MKLNPTISSYLQKSPEIRRSCNKCIPVLLILAACFIFQNNTCQIIRKTKVNFFSEDSLLITADLYYSDLKNPFILLFHTENSSRGEFTSIAERFLKMNYNCLAVDLRSGGKYEFTENETANRAKAEGFNTSLSDSEADILAAMKYIRTLSKKEFLLLGSSSSASLCLKLAVNCQDVKGVMAFSPGEFFRPEVDISEYLHDFNKSVFVTGSGAEIPYLIDMFHGMESNQLNMYKPVSVHDKRGVSILLDTNVVGKEYWLALLIYIKSL